jgi:hypothetical protein
MQVSVTCPICKADTGSVPEGEAGDLARNAVLALHSCAGKPRPRLHESLEPARWTPARFALATFAASGVWFGAWKLFELWVAR